MAGSRKVNQNFLESGGKLVLSSNPHCEKIQESAFMFLSKQKEETVKCD